MSKETFSRLRAAAIDERLLNPIFRREQLQRLHNSLQSNRQALCDAAINDAHTTKAEAAVELHLALDTVKEQYVSIDPEQELKDEYRLAHRKNYEERRKPFGIVYIEPCSHTLTFAVVSALTAAIAAGNCTVVQIENTLQSLPKLLKETLEEALDSDILAICATRPDDEFLGQCLQVLQRGSRAAPKINELVSPASDRVIAVIDRTANIDEAAKALVSARFAFHGQSPYAPDVVLINEFVKKPFLEAAVRHSIGFISNGGVQANGSSKRSNAKVDPGRELVDRIRKGSAGDIISTGDKGTIVDIKKSTSELLTEKIHQNALLVHAVTSMDDAITLANRKGLLAAAYVFANLPSVKYLSQFIESRVAFANHVPPQLLVGPGAPVNVPVSPQIRYSTSMFSTPRPQYANPSQDSAPISEALQSANQSGISRLLTAASRLPPAKPRPEGTGIGFFEQGIIVGALVVSTPILAGIGVSLFYGYRAVAARLFG